MRFALFFGNRGVFPGEIIAAARREMTEAVTRCGFEYIIMDEKLTRFGAVETCLEGEAYAEFLRQNEGNYDGVIICLPNFGDENGISVAMSEVKVPILVQAYPDVKGEMGPALRRDAYCGKLAVCNILRQCGIPFSLTDKYAVSPTDPAFDADLARFEAICRTVKGMRRFKVGVFGGRTTPFKTTRFDETTLQKSGITVETFDLEEIFEKVDSMPDVDAEDTLKSLTCYACYNGRDLKKAMLHAKFIKVFEEYIANYRLSAIGVRCWEDFQRKYEIAPCICMSYLTDKGIPSACETDVTSAVMMRALSLASGSPAMLLDVNNNYGDDQQRCILFHCGVSPASMMTCTPSVCAHKLFARHGDCTGTVAGGLISGPVTVGSLRTENGRIYAFAGTGSMTDEPIDEDFFGTASVFYKENLKEMLKYMSRNGYKHHTVVAKGDVADIVDEVFRIYLGYEIDLI